MYLPNLALLACHLLLTLLCHLATFLSTSSPATIQLLLKHLYLIVSLHDHRLLFLGAFHLVFILALSQLHLTLDLLDLFVLTPGNILILLP